MLNRWHPFGLILCVYCLGWGGASAHAFQLPAVDYAWLGERIESNETGGKDENLTFWSPAEPFPSFGIGQFIWFPEHIDVPFESTFPQMVAFVSQQTRAPDWAHQPYAPWPNKTAFDQAWLSADMIALREWLKQTKSAQAAFIVQRFQTRLNQLLVGLPAQQADDLALKITQLSQHHKTLFAMIDYSNFKGFGTHPDERYQQQGWGLLQVLMHMPALSDDEAANLEAFIHSGQAVLSQRVALAPPERNEMRWLKGWHHRMNQYVKD